MVGIRKYVAEHSSYAATGCIVVGEQIDVPVTHRFAKPLHAIRIQCTERAMDGNLGRKHAREAALVVLAFYDYDYVHG
jgi:hypothetical protein